MNHQNLEQAVELLRAGHQLSPEASRMVADLITSRIAPIEDFVFAPVPGGWMVGEKGFETFHAAKKKGYQFIFNLLDNPRKNIHCVMLFHNLQLVEGQIDITYQMADNCRTNIQKRIKSALENIPGHIGKHLRASILCGYNCGYHPSKMPKWTLAHKRHTSI